MAGAAHQAGELQRLADDAPQLLRIERLEEVVVRPVLHGGDRRVGGRHAGDEHNGDAGIGPANGLIQLQPGAIGQAYVEQDGVGHLGR